MSPRQRQVSSLQAMLASNSHSAQTLPTQPKKLSVSFGTIEIREYNRIVGDHPEVRVGPPVSMTWEFKTLPKLHVDEYEEARPPRRTMLRMSSITRKNILLNVFRVPEKEIQDAEYEVQKIRKQRERTVNQNDAVARVDSSVKRVGRKLRIGFMNTLSNSVKFMSANMPVAVPA